MVSGRRILVAGASGFIGSRLVETLVDRNANVTAVVRSARKAVRFANLDVAIREVDLRDRSGIADAVRNHDAVINVAHDLRAAEHNNVRAFADLADACSKARVHRLVHTSSIVVYDDWPGGDLTEESPHEGTGSGYKNAKSVMERDLSARAASGDLSSVIIQPTIVYGPCSWLWTDQIVERLLSGTVILPDSCRGTCNAVYVDDVVDSLILGVSASPGPAESFIISGPEPVTWREFFETYNRMLECDSIRYAEMGQIENDASGTLGRLKSIAADPTQVGRWMPFRRVSNLLRKAAGETAVDRIRSTLMRLRKLRGPMIYYPTADEIRLYRSTGICYIDKAVRELGYSPSYSFERGAIPTADYINERFLGGVE